MEESAGRDNASAGAIVQIVAEDCAGISKVFKHLKADVVITRFKRASGETLLCWMQSAIVHHELAIDEQAAAIVAFNRERDAAIRRRRGRVRIDKHLAGPADAEQVVQITKSAEAWTGSVRNIHLRIDARMRRDKRIEVRIIEKLRC